MSIRYQREGSPPIPPHYRAPIYRPCPLSDPMGKLAWDMADTWQTTAEWLAWYRRSGNKTRYWTGGKWRYPMRPQIEYVARSNLKKRVLP